MNVAVKFVLTLYGLFLFALFFSAMAYVTVAGPGGAMIVWFTLLIVGTVGVCVAAISVSSDG